MMLCPCGSTRPYADCCQPLHLGQTQASSPEQLMRSRYCAFVQGQAQYLYDTHHPEFRAGLSVDELAEASQQTQWLGLTIVAAPAPQGSQGVVEFKARFHQGEDEGILHERSRFALQQGRWLYCDGEFDPKPVAAGRNAPCPCGSGKKFKRCCG
ncbi:YchJ family protein [Ferrimonas marina]|uniref:UPF0225 protein SAMN02745129_0611 n=1 Tax=Ferrimonas marina TaxID=299255 RepID=A0A1M5ME00_9GAMM|nr:YchJ family protein [Ferrimonas marina]SHG75431.1 SEC-C motif-containing protein [Ferrimonas marina]